MCGMFHLREAAFYQTSQMSLPARANSNQLKKDSSYFILIYMCKIFIQLESAVYCQNKEMSDLAIVLSTQHCLSYGIKKKSTCA